MRSFCRLGTWCALATLVAGLAHGADTFTLNDGQVITGDMISPDDSGVRIRQEDDSYAQVTLSNGKTDTRIPWSRFSQDDLKKVLTNDRLKAATFVFPWIDVPPPQRAREQAFSVRQISRLTRPARGSLIGGFASSGIGLTILCLLYLANMYAAYEISILRAYPWPLVCGLAAVLPVIAPVLFASLPAHTKSHAAESSDLLAAQAAAVETAAIHGDASAAAAPASGLGLAARGEAATAELPPTQVFPRGQFTFNRRFFETKFSNFFGMVRRESEKDLVLIFKTVRGQFTADRISRIAANDLHLQVRRGKATEEVAVPFVEVQEVVLKHKDAPD